MRVLVVYASRHGATQGIAQRLAAELRAAGQHARVRSVVSAGDLRGDDAFVIGSAVYSGHWLAEATEFVDRNRAVLARRPVWLYSSGPLGTRTTHDLGRDPRDALEPADITRLREMLHPRDHRVFFGALDPGRLGLRDRALRAMSAERAVLPEGDFRDWPAIEAWARGIAHQLAPVPAWRGQVLGPRSSPCASVWMPPLTSARSDARSDEPAQRQPAPPNALPPPSWRTSLDLDETQELGQEGVRDMAPSAGAAVLPGPGSPRDPRREGSAS